MHFYGGRRASVRKEGRGRGRKSRGKREVNKEEESANRMGINDKICRELYKEGPVSNKIRKGR